MNANLCIRIGAGAGVGIGRSARGDERQSKAGAVGELVAHCDPLALDEHLEAADRSASETRIVCRKGKLN